MTSSVPGELAKRTLSGAGAATDRTSGDDSRLLERVRAGDERAVTQLVETYGDSMIRVALLYVSTRAIAEEVVQEAWLGVLTGAGRFQGRSSLKTWIMSIVKHKAQNRAHSEERSLPFSSLGGTEQMSGEPSAPPDRFLGPGERWSDHWKSPPRDWSELPEDRLLSKETLAIAMKAMADLPPTQRAVIELRDVQGWDAAEAREYLELSEGNQRVLLHRARSKVRQALEDYLNEFAPVP